MILTDRAIPIPLPAIYIYANKLNKDASLRKSKRPISLFCTPKEAIESVALRRLFPAPEPRFVNCQYAYGRIRRTEFHAAELRSFLRGDSSRQPGIRGRLLPRRRLFRTLDRPHIGPHLLRFINEWLSDGRFRLRLIARNG